VLTLITCFRLSSFAAALSNAEYVLSEIGMFNQIDMNKVKLKNLFYCFIFFNVLENSCATCLSCSCN